MHVVPIVQSTPIKVSVVTLTTLPHKSNCTGIYVLNSGLHFIASQNMH